MLFIALLFVFFFIWESLFSMVDLEPSPSENTQEEKLKEKEVLSLKELCVKSMVFHSSNIDNFTKMYKNSGKIPPELHEFINRELDSYYLNALENPHTCISKPISFAFQIPEAVNFMDENTMAAYLNDDGTQIFIARNYYNATCKCMLGLFNVADGKTLWKTQDPQRLDICSANDRQIITAHKAGSNFLLKLWNKENGKFIKKFTIDARNEIRYLSLSNTGLLSIKFDTMGTEIWNIQSEKKESIQLEKHSPFVSLNNKTIISRDKEGNLVSEFKIDTSYNPESLELIYEKQIAVLGCCEDEPFFIADLKNRKIISSTGKFHYPQIKPSNGMIYSREIGPEMSIEISADGRTIVEYCNENKEIKIYAIGTAIDLLRNMTWQQKLAIIHFARLIKPCELKSIKEKVPIEDHLKTIFQSFSRPIQEYLLSNYAILESRYLPRIDDFAADNDFAAHGEANRLPETKKSKIPWIDAFRNLKNNPKFYLCGIPGILSSAVGITWLYNKVPSLHESMKNFFHRFY